jgi:predicted transcriptional regulator
MRYFSTRLKTEPCKFCNGTGKQIDHASVGKELRELRIRSKVSLRAIANLMHLSASYISDLELGKRHWHTNRIKAFKLWCNATTTTNKPKGK